MEKIVSELKKEIRKEKKALRKGLDKDKREALSEMICSQIIKTRQYQEAETIMIYNAMLGEVSLCELEKTAKEDDKILCYPLCLDKTKMTALLPDSEEAFISGAYGIKEPDIKRSREIKPEDIDLIIVPCTAFDEKCRRIGMGAGYYDRYLEKCKKAYTMAVAYEIQKVEDVPVDEFDKILDSVVSEDRIYLKETV